MNTHNIGGNTTVIIRDFNTQKVLTVLTNVNRVEIGYDNTNSVKQQTKNLLSYSSIYPSTLSFSATTINDGILKILTDNSYTSVEKVYREEVHYLDSTLALTSIFLPQEVTKKDIISFQANNVEVEFKYDEALNAIVDLHLLTTYKVIYQVKTEVKKSILQKQSQNYYTIEVLGNGNLDNVGTSILMTVPKAGLAINPTLTFDSVSLVNIPLTFNIADSIMTIQTY